MSPEGRGSTVAEVAVELPNPLRPYAGGLSEVRVQGDTVLEALKDLERRHPALAPYLFGPADAVRRNLAVFVNEVDFRELEGARTPLRADDRLALVPALSGGAPDPLSPDERARYGRHLNLPGLGEAGQRKLRNARVLLVGTGGLGAPAALYLAAAGVGTLGVVDFDRVELSNLQRQVLFATPDVGRSKVEVTGGRLRALNPHVRIETFEGQLTPINAMNLVRKFDLVVDGSDNFATRYLVNDACVLAKKPDIFGSVYRFEGQATVFDGRVGPCYRCLFPEPPPAELVPSCAAAGVLGVVPGLLGLVLATEAIKLLAGIGEPLVGRLLIYDALALRFRELPIRKDPGCVLCGPAATQHALLDDYATFCGEPVRDDNEGPEEVSVTELRAEMRGPEPPMLVDVREPHEWTEGHIDGATLVPFDELNARAGEFSPTQAMVVYCANGNRSLWAIRLLRAKGFVKVHSLRGGFVEWTRDDPASGM